MWIPSQIMLYFFNDTATTEIYTLSLHDALPICEFYVVDDQIKVPNISDIMCVLVQYRGNSHHSYDGDLTHSNFVSES